MWLKNFLNYIVKNIFIFFKSLYRILSEHKPFTTSHFFKATKCKTTHMFKALHHCFIDILIIIFYLFCFKFFKYNLCFLWSNLISNCLPSHLLIIIPSKSHWYLMSDEVKILSLMDIKRSSIIYYLFNYNVKLILII